MTERHQQQWEALGANDPYWAVLTDPAKKNGRWNKATFFETGVDEVDCLLKKISLLDIELRCELALDYGCGVGRISRALSIPFQHVLGIDFSEAMLAEARIANGGFDNIQFLSNNGNSLPGVADGSVDLVYSNIVLQHTPRKSQRLLIREFCRVLRPGGILVFQTPSHQNMATFSGILHFLLGNRILNVARRIRYGKGRVMEIHTIRKAQVLRLLEERGASVREIERYDSSGTAFVSYRYFAIKV